MAAGQKTTIEFSTASAPLNPTLGQRRAASPRAAWASADAVKPDLVAPGVAITSSARGRRLRGRSPARRPRPRRSPAPPRSSCRRTRTGRSRPPRGALIGYAASVGTAAVDGLEPVEAQGAGSVDGAAATAATLVAEPSTLSFGTARPAPRVSRRAHVVLRNLGSRPSRPRSRSCATSAEGGASLALDRRHPERAIPPGASQCRCSSRSTRAGSTATAGVRGGWILVERPGAPAAAHPLRAGRGRRSHGQPDPPARSTPRRSRRRSARRASPRSWSWRSGAVGGDGATKLAIAPVSRLTRRPLPRLAAHRAPRRGAQPAAGRLPLRPHGPLAARRGARAGPLPAHDRGGVADGVTSERDVAFTVR